MNYYVYVLFCEDGRPFYVGKGQGRRWLVHETDARAGKCGHRSEIIRRMFALGFHEIPKIKVHKRLTEARAHEYEQILIGAIGRRPFGPLVNLTDGGEGMSDPSPEIRTKLRARWRGKKHSPETKAKMSAAARGRKLSPETLAKLSAFARSRSSEHRAKIGTANRGRKHSAETRAKMSAARKQYVAQSQGASQ